MNTEYSIEDLEALQTQRKSAILRSKQDSKERRKEILKLHLVDKVPMATLGRRFNISRQRIYQIINNIN